MLFAFAGLLAQTPPDWLWVTTATGANTQTARAIDTDQQGNQYVTGYFESATSFGSITITSIGGSDIYAAKCDPDGNWLWAVRAGSSSSDYGWDIDVDSSGNVYLTGYFKNTADFGSSSLTSYGGSDIYAAKLDSNGNWLWVVQAGGTGDDMGYGIGVDNNGDTLITGKFMGTATFGATTLTSLGFSETYVAKLDADGAWLWALKAGGTNVDEGHDVAADPQGNVYLTGIFRGSSTFGTIGLTADGYSDVFVAKLDPDGNWLWAKRGGGDHGTYGDQAYGIAVDATGNTFLTGYFYGTGSFGSTSFTSLGSHDLFVAKIAANGDWLWANHAGGTGSDTGWGVDVNSGGEVFLTGNIQGMANFGSISLTGMGLSDIFVAALNSAGQWTWALEAGSTANDYGMGIGLDGDGDLYVHGTYSAVAQFGDISQTSSGGFDIYVAKLSFTGTPNGEDLAPGTQGSFLQEISPNPFRGGTPARIKALVAGGDSGSLEVFNLKGQCVFRRELNPGTHELGLDGGNLPSGVYLCRLKTRLSSSVRKVVLIN